MAASASALAAPSAPCGGPNHDQGITAGPRARPEAGPLGLVRSAAGPLSGARLAGGGHGLEHLLHALRGIAAVSPRCQDARQLARLGPGQDRAGAHLEPSRHLGGTEQDLQVAAGGRLLASLTELVIG